MFKPVQHTPISSKVGILYFHRTIEEEFEHKSAITSRNWSQFRALFVELHKQVKRTLEKANLPIIEIASHQQQGSSFGDRISNALSHAFDQGYEHLIIIGNDCPQLSPKLLNQAKEQLLSGHAVLGPDHQGGAYLIGLSRSQFVHHDFATLPWQKPELLKALTAVLGNPSELEHYQDLNSSSDLMAFSGKASRSLKSIILTSIRKLNISEYSFPTPRTSTLSSIYLRPPPETRPTQFV